MLYPVNKCIAAMKHLRGMWHDKASRIQVYIVGGVVEDRAGEVGDRMGELSKFEGK